MWGWACAGLAEAMCPRAVQCTELYWWTHTSIAGPAGASRIKDTVLGRFGVGVLGPGATGGRYRRINLLVASQWMERFES